ncbi:alpha/beta hydrolase [Roseofilum casamattae]|uniref:Alpha/beta hydrolase n=1 Tax=Roseofilum casamattae BLCC-M143 TaxID=3022442 RepID=A0ABT7BTJ8_9CYAN|nr:alpha/beta hydrolase [Roseofilum casamattae]MDJ1182507.1 alpha/beta hydrolase [Roseofilum casamattae BLCC-M143]
MDKVRSITAPTTSRLRFLGTSQKWMNGLVLGTAASLLCWMPTARASETIIFKYQSEQVTLGVRELKEFVRSGEVPSDFQRFLRNTDNVPAKVREVLNLSIRVNPKLFRRLANTSTGEFAILKLDEAIASSASRDDLEAVRSTLIEAVEAEGKLTLISLLERYPIETVTVDLSSLEPAYLQVRALIERVIPALEVAKEFLQDLVCECEQSSHVPGEAVIATTDPSLPTAQSQCPPSNTARETDGGMDVGHHSPDLEPDRLTELSHLSTTVE